MLGALVWVAGGVVGAVTPGAGGCWLTPGMDGALVWVAGGLVLVVDVQATTPMVVTLMAMVVMPRPSLV